MHRRRTKTNNDHRDMSNDEPWRAELVTDFTNSNSPSPTRHLNLPTSSITAQVSSSSSSPYPKMKSEFEPLQKQDGSINDDDDYHDEENRDYQNRPPLTTPLELYGPHLKDSSNSNSNFSSSVLSSILPTSFLNYLYPPDLPPPVQLLRKENIAIPACYLTVGLLQGFSGPFINVYPRFLGATEAQQASISAIRNVPAIFKLGFGFWSDNVKFRGYRRKSYMFLGWGLSSLSMFSLVYFSNLQKIVVDTDDDDGNGNVTYGPASDAPSINFLSFVLLMFGTGFWFADVMGDSLVAEKAKLEPERSRGQLQSTCYACRFFGLMVAAPVGTVLYDSYGPEFVVKCMGVIPMMMLPFIWNLWEVKDLEVASTRDQCAEIWRTVCSRAVWQPMGFVYLYNVLQIGNAAWREYLMSILLFTDNQMNSLLIVANVLLYLGIMAYKNYFIHWSWRSIYVVTTLINTVLSSLQILLIYNITFGLSPFMFALGDDVFADFIAGIQFLPTTIMMVHLCPSGSEGASYAMFTTVNNSALGMAGALSTVVLKIWDVSKETMLGGDLSGMVKLTIFTTCLQTSGVLFVKLLPHTKDDLSKLHNDPMSGSRVGGFIFLSITFLSILYALGIGLLNIVNPGWNGESRI